MRPPKEDIHSLFLSLLIIAMVEGMSPAQHISWLIRGENVFIPFSGEFHL